MFNCKKYTVFIEWEIYPCAKCGMPELFDAPSDLISVVFPTTQRKSLLQMFTALCPGCGDWLVVERKKEKNV